MFAATVGVVYTTGQADLETNWEISDVTGADEEQKEGKEHEIGNVHVTWGTQDEND